MEGYICSSNSGFVLGSSSSLSHNSLRHRHHYLPNSFVPFSTTKKASPLMLLQTHRSISGGCSVAELERELEWIGTGKFEEEEEEGKKKKKLVEVLESLEMEAIMGDDEGRDPDDYNRRAQIFDKSNKVFQALKKHEQQQEHHQEGS